MKKKIGKVICAVLVICFVGALVFLYAKFDLALEWNKWGLQEDGETWVYPNWKYIFLILYKLILYLLFPLLYSFILAIFNDKNVKKHKYTYYLLKTLNIWFLCLLIIRIFANTVLEVDRLFGIELFSSINEIETLVGFVLTLILRKNVKIDNKIDEKYGESVNDFVKEYNYIKNYAVSVGLKNTASSLMWRIDKDFTPREIGEEFNVVYVYYLLDDFIEYPLGQSNVIYIGSTKGEINNGKRSLGFRFKHCLSGKDSKQNISLSKMYNSGRKIGVNIYEIPLEKKAENVEKELQNKFLDEYGAYPIATGASYSRRKEIVNDTENSD